MTSSSIKIGYDSDADEIDIVMPSRQAIESLALVLRAGHGSLSVESGIASTSYVVNLERIVVEAHAEELVAISVDAEDGRLFITGDPRYLEILAENVMGVADLSKGGHVHVEYFPGHYYLSPHSSAAVLRGA
ncbi:hypothetical protein [Micromonospora sp. NPDC051141]|uniref:Imm32 family immunity protein n=1 Tax=Micromonospora sp. NPDC051141 TaxID=3364284 RepID=UPI0037A3D3F5